MDCLLEDGVVLLPGGLSRLVATRTRHARLTPSPMSVVLKTNINIFDNFS